MLNKLMTHKEQLVLAFVATAIVIGAMAVYIRDGQDGAAPNRDPEQTETLSKPAPAEDLGPGQTQLRAPPAIKPRAPEEEIVNALVVVSIAGAVEEPGVYRLDEDARVEDLIVRAGGAVQSADLRDINRAARLIDGTTLTIPFGPSVRSTGDMLVVEQRAGNAVLNHPQYTLHGWQPDAFDDLGHFLPAEKRREAAADYAEAGDDLVDINHATVNELQTLPNIGPKLGRRIFDYVKEYPIRAVEDLDNVDGIGPKRLESIRNKIIIR